MSQGDTPAPGPTEEVTSAVESTNRTAGTSLGGPTALLVTLACVVIVIFGMRYAADVLNPILTAMFVVMGLSPVLRWLRSRGVPPWLAIVIVLALFLAVAAVFIGALASSFGQLNSRLPFYQENLSGTMADVQRWFADHGINASGLLSDVLTPARIMGFVSSLVGTVLGTLSDVFIMLLIVIFMLSEVYSFPRNLHEKLHLSERFAKAFGNFGDVTRSYLFTKAWISAISAIINIAVYFAFGVDFALLWGLLFFLLSFIPNIGFVLSVIPPFFVTLLEFGFTRAIIVIVVVIVFNAIVDNMIAPRFMGRSVGLSTLAVFLSVVIWAWVLGPVGALISIPLTLMVKLLFLDSYDSTRPLSLFLAGGAERVVRRSKKGNEASD